MSPIERPFTPRVEHTLARAGEIAGELDHAYVGTEHLILALIDDAYGIAGAAMHRLDVAEAIRAEVVRIIYSPGYRSSTDPAPADPE